MHARDDDDSGEMHYFDLTTILTATNNFFDANKLGEGGFSPVYKGKLINGKEIAVKRLSMKSKQGLEEFKNEVILIAKLQHKNLVRLLGCCLEEDEKLLVYEFMANTSLGAFLFGKGVELIDQTIVDICPISEALRLIHIALLCVQEDPNDRPTMSRVNLMLASKSINLPKPSAPPISVGRLIIFDQSSTIGTGTGTGFVTSDLSSTRASS
nr:g-type lectin s-receptor-like serine/threonine-protein kinase [Quercus suber]